MHGVAGDDMPGQIEFLEQHLHAGISLDFHRFRCGPGPGRYRPQTIPKVRATIKVAGGHLVAASQQVTPIEGDALRSRITINSWESLERIQAWRDSPEYKEARTIGDKYAKFIRSFVAEGVPQQCRCARGEAARQASCPD
jgi:uncharacterized protein (DUF1330 family)